MTKLKRTSSEDKNFIALVGLLDADLAIRDGADHTFYAQFNKIDKINNCIVAYENDQPVGCGAIREIDAETIEIKRMYIQPDSRQKGLATLILKELECWSTELGYRKCVLETGKKQPEAVALYEKNNYQRTANYGPYLGVENSLCFEKVVG